MELETRMGKEKITDVKINTDGKFQQTVTTRFINGVSKGELRERRRFVRSEKGTVGFTSHYEKELENN